MHCLVTAVLRLLHLISQFVFLLKLPASGVVKAALFFVSKFICVSRKISVVPTSELNLRLLNAVTGSISLRALARSFVCKIIGLC